MLQTFGKIMDQMQSTGYDSTAITEITTVADKWFGVLEERLPSDGFVLGLALPTAADVAVLNIVKAYVPFGAAYALAHYDACAKWPKLGAHVDRVAKYPTLEAYLQSSETMQADPFNFKSLIQGVDASVDPA